MTMLGAGEEGGAEGTREAEQAQGEERGRGWKRDVTCLLPALSIVSSHLPPDSSLEGRKQLNSLCISKVSSLLNNKKHFQESF